MDAQRLATASWRAGGGAAAGGVDSVLHYCLAHLGAGELPEPKPLQQVSNRVGPAVAVATAVHEGKVRRKRRRERADCPHTGIAISLIMR